jgi:hypothetical protein
MNAELGNKGMNQKLLNLAHATVVVPGHTNFAR